MSDPVVFMLGVVAGVAWLSSVVHVGFMVRHRAPGVSALYLLTHGMAFFSGEKFTAGATRHRGWFLRSAGLFFACVFALGLLSGLRSVRG